MKRWIGAGVVAVMTVSAVADDWPVWREPNGNGISSETGIAGFEDAPVWSKELGVGYSSVSVKDGHLYTMGHTDGTDTVFCLDALTGKEIWTHRYPCETGQYKGPRATPVVDGEYLYTVSREGDVFCLELDSGKVVWQTRCSGRNRHVQYPLGGFLFGGD